LKRKVIYVYENNKNSSSQDDNPYKSRRQTASKTAFSSHMAKTGSQILLKDTVKERDYFNYNKKRSDAYQVGPFE